MTGATPFLQARQDREKLELERVVHNLCPKCEAPHWGEARVLPKKHEYHEHRTEDKRHMFHCLSCGWTDRSDVEDSNATVYGYPGSDVTPSPGK